MKLDEIEAAVEDFKLLLDSAVDIAANEIFLRRVLTQAVLTHGGKLRIDPALGELAQKETRELWVGGGEVVLVERPKP